jgi:flavodoxin
MKCLLPYYSGAGNTEYVADIVEGALVKYGCDVVKRRLTVHNYDRLKDDFDILCVGFPAYFREAPGLVYDCLSSFSGRGRPMFLFCTKGFYSGNAARNVLSFAKESGFEPRGGFECFMPSTDALVLFAGKGTILERALKAGRSARIAEKAEALIGRVVNGSDYAIPGPKWYTLLDDHLVRPLERRLSNEHKVFAARLHTLRNRCNQCELCVHGCPRNNIELTEGRYYFRPSLRRLLQMHSSMPH